MTHERDAMGGRAHAATGDRADGRMGNADTRTDVGTPAGTRADRVDPRTDPRTDHGSDPRIAHGTDPRTAPVADPRMAPGTDPRVDHGRDGHVEQHAETRLDHRAVVARERAEFGGIKVGSAFFGWLTATGTAVLLTALLAAVGVGIGLGTGTDADEATSQANQNAETVGLAGAIALLAVLFVSYYCGGYVAGRMARFNGAKQGFAVWLWALLAAGVVAIMAAVAGDRWDVLARLNGFPRLPINEGDLPTAAIVTALALAAAALIGAILGGLAGMRYHRRVDRVGMQAGMPTTTTTAS